MGVSLTKPTSRPIINVPAVEFGLPTARTGLSEEIYSNIVRNAIEDRKEHAIDIRLACTDSQIEIEIIDDGIAFNPLDYHLGPQSDPATSDAGGMGLTLIRAFSSKISYQRNSGKNHLKITKKVNRK